MKLAKEAFSISAKGTEGLAGIQRIVKDFLEEK